MRINLTQIMKATNCSEEQALNVERYINQGDMLDWSEASARMINTIARAVNDKLLRDAPRKKAKVKVTVTKPAKKASTKASKAYKVRKETNVKAGTKIAQAMEVYQAKINSNRNSRQDIIAALAHTMQITPVQAAGYYQNCKKKLA